MSFDDIFGYRYFAWPTPEKEEWTMVDDKDKKIHPDEPDPPQPETPGKDDLPKKEDK